MLNTFKIKPYQWQLNALQLSYAKKDLALLAEMGTGKSGALVNILRARYMERSRVRRTLILSPLVTLFNWKNEFKIHSNVPQDKVVVLAGNGSADKIKTMTNEVLSKSDQNVIVITNYEALLSDKLYKMLLNWGAEIFVGDEIHMCKNHKAKRSKAVHNIAIRADHRYILTGTPILNNVSDIFMQYKILDGGDTFGDNFFVFKNSYMRDGNEAWKGRHNYFPKWEARPEKFSELQKKIYTKAIRVTKAECLDLPPLVQEIYPVPLGTDQARYYKQMEKDFLTWVEEGTKKGIAVAQLAVTKALRLQQIASGFVTTDDGKDIEFKDNPRIDAVKHLIQDLHSEHKIILWCSFKNNYKQLAKVCEELKIQYTMLIGDMNGDEKNTSINKFNTDPSCRVIIANRRAGGIGVNLVASDVSIVYSRNFSLEEELQSESRNHRGGSEVHERILRINLCSQGTIDETITQALLNKQEVANAIVEIVRGNK